MVVTWGLRGKLLLAPLLLGVLASLPPCPVFANPTGGTVSAGNASISSSGNTLTVNQSTNSAVIDWRGFDIAQGETTNFVQPSSSSITLNRVNSPSASYINGALNANGNIVIVNQNGVLFGKNAQVNVNSLVVSTADIDNKQFMAGNYAFNKPGNPNATIQNEGMITAKQAGLVGLVAPNVLNSGIITAKLGTIQLASGDTFTVDLYGDNLMSVQASPALQSQLVSNTGKLIAKGGTIAMTAAAAGQTVNSLINVAGELDATSVAKKNGSIYIFAEGSNAVPDNATADKGTKTGTSTVNVSGKLNVSSKTGTGGTVNVLGDNVTLASTASIKANGATGGGIVNVGGQTHGTGTTPTALTTTIENGAFIQANATQNGNGGDVTVWSDQATIMNGSILAQGGAQSGNGGSVETSSHGLLGLAGSVDASAPNGLAGSWLLDPVTVTISASGSNSVPSTGGTVNPTGTTYSILNTSISTALSNGNNVTITSGSSGDGYSGTGDITVSGVITATGAGSLTLSAYRDIDITSAITLQGGGLTLQSANSGNNIGAINIAAAVATNGGNITIGGGSGMITGGTLNTNGTVATAATGYAYGDAQYANGVSISNNVSAGSGTIIINGEGYATTTNGNRGVYISNGSVNTTGSGIITINGVGGGMTASANNNGVYVASSDGVETTGTGNINIVSTGGGGAGSGGANVGFEVTGASAIYAAGSGSITINATGGNSTGAEDRGIGFGSVASTANIVANNGNITLVATGGPNPGATNDHGYIDDSGGGGVETTGTGSIFITASGGVSTSGHAFNILSANDIRATGTGSITIIDTSTTNQLGVGAAQAINTASGNITLYTNSLSLGATNAVDSTGSLTIAPYTNATMSIGPSSGSTLNVSTAQLADLTAASYVFGSLTAGNGSASTGALTVNTSTNFGSANVTFLSGGSITVAGNYSWSTGALVDLSATQGITINSGVSITNTYTGGTFGAGSIPVVLALRADNASAVNGSGVSTNSYGVTNNGTINFSGSTGAVSIFNDSGFTAVNGTETGKTGGWTAPTNDSVSNQFTTYKLINGVGDLTAISLSGTYAFGTNINGGGAAFNSNTPLGSFSGILDGQWCALAGGSNCGLTNLTMTTSGTITNYGLFSSLGGSAIIRNFLLGLTVTDTFSGSSGNTVGNLAAGNNGIIANVTTTGTVSDIYTGNESANGVYAIGGLVGSNSGTGQIIDSASTGGVNYSFQGTNTGSYALYIEVGGLVGYNPSTNANGIYGSYSTGPVVAQITNGYNGNSSPNVGGLVGDNGNAGSVVSNSFSTSSVSTGFTGCGSCTAAGLVGFNVGTVLDSYTTGQTTATAGSTGGLVAYNISGTITNSYWDGGSGTNYGTTGKSSSSGGGTRDTTTTLQSALQTGFSSSIWGIVAGVSYPYLLWQAPSGTPQVVSGTAYSNRGTTALAGASVGVLVNGSSSGSLLGSTESSGANGYYYFLLAPNTISGSGSNVLTYLTGSTKGNAFYDSATGSLSSFNIYGNELLTTSASSALSTITSDLSTALGANSGSNFLFSLSSGNLTATAGDNLEFNTSASTLTLDKTMTASSGGDVILNDSHTVTQSAAITAPNLLLIGGGTYTLTNSSNSIGTVAGTTGACSITDSAALTIGSLAGTTGLTATGNVTLAADSMTFTNSITATGQTLTLIPYTHTDTVGIGPTTGSALNISDAMLTNTTAGSYVFGATTAGDGSATTGNMTVNTAHNFGTSAVTFISGNNINLNGAVTDGNTGTAVTLDATGNFINNYGSSAINLTGSGSPRWLIYAATPSATNNTFGSLNSGNTAVWDATYGGTISQTGDRYVFAYQPTVTFTTTSDSKTYGTSYASTVVNDYSISGLSTGVANAFSADSNATAFSGTPTVTSTGSVASASVAGGPYAITITQNLTGVDGYAVAYNSAGLLTVNKANLTITANSPSMTYGASSLPTLSASYSGFVNSETSSNLTTLPTVTTTATAYNGSAGSGSSVGTYSTTAAGAVDNNYNISYVGGVLTVGKANLTVTANSPSMTYGASSLPTLSASYSGFANGDSSANLTTAPSVTTTATAYNGTAGSGSIVGTYSTTASGAVDNNYNISYVGGTLTVNKANLTVTANSPSMTYGASSLPTLSASYTGLADGDTSSNLTTAPTVTTTATAYNGSAGSGSSVGTYSTTASGAVDSNYNISYVGGILTVGKANLTISANSPSMTYGASSLPSLSASYSGFANGDASGNLTTAPTVTTAATAYNGSAGSGSSVGTYSTTALGAVDNNYNISYVGGILTVGKANLTITANSPNMTYGASSLPNLSASYTGLVNGDTSSNLTTAPTVTTTATAYNGTAGSGSSAGTYSTSAAGAVDGNYNISFVGGTLTVNKANLTITANSPSMTYGASSLPTLSASYSGLANGDTSSNLTTSPTVTTTATSYNGSAGSGSSVGTFSTTAAGAVDNNYNISYIGGTLTVNPATLTVTANSPSMTYGSSILPSLSASYSGFANGDTSSNLTTAPTVTTTATAYNGSAGSGSSVGNYSTTASGAVDNNYTINYVGGTLTVGKANLTITANSPNMTYGAASLPSLSASYSGLANGDTSSNLTTAPTVTTTATAYNGTAGSGSSVGTYATTAAGAVDNNYNISYVGGNLTVNKANLTVTADSTSMTYGGTRQPLTASYSGFANGDTSSNLTTAPTIVSATPVTANAGTYTGTITASGTIDNNYNISYVAGDLTIGKAYLTITADNKTMTYGGTMPTLTASYSGFVNGDSSSSLSTSPTVVSATPATANAGTYNGTITASGAVDNNYSFIYNAGNLTVGQAPLTITANSPSMVYGASSLPSLSASYSGLVNGDTASNLTTRPTVTTTATAYNGTAGSGSSVGTYATTAIGAVDNNYTISYVGGVLTVNKANLTITANSPNMTYGASSLPNLSASYSGLANGDTASSLTTTPTVTTAATAYNGTAGSGSSVGTYATAASGAIDNNYNISYVGGTLTVNKANLTISADSQSMTYGGIMPTLTASYTGLVNGDSSSSLTTEPSIISATPATANAGTYNGTITASGALDNNYTISYAAGNLTINKAPLTISADNQAITYGASVPTGSITYNGLVNGDSPASLTTQPTLTTTQSGVPNAGTYADAYTVSGAASGNYTLSYIDGTLTVQKLNLTVTTYDQSINLGQPLPTFTGSNNLLAQDVPLVGWNYAPISYSGGIGTYQIGASASDPYNRLANYNIAMNDGTLAVLVANASQLPPTVQVTSQNPLSDVTSYAPTGIVSNPNSNSSGANNLSGAVFATSSNGALVKTFGMLDIVMTPALQQQLGYTYTPQTN